MKIESGVSRARPDRPEPTTRAGEVLLSHNHLCLLHGLYDRPDGMALTTRDWVAAALPYARLFRQVPSEDRLCAAIGSVHREWVTVVKVGRGKRQWWLTNRGNAIVKLEIPCRIRGRGPYDGLRALREAAKPLIPQAVVVESPENYCARTDAWWESVRRSSGDPVVEGIFTYLAHWSVRNRAVGVWATVGHAVRLERLRRYICNHVMATQQLPTGTHHISPQPGQQGGFDVNFALYT